MGFIRDFKRGLAGEADGNAYTVAGKRFVCPHCASDRFIEGRAQLNTAA